MIDLSDITFNIPVKYDTDDRIENLKVIVDYLNKHFITNIIVMERDREPKFDFIKEKCQYVFEKTDEIMLRRTYCLNKMCLLSKTPYISNYDTDVLFQIKDYTDTLELLKNGVEMVYPYNGKFLECNRKQFFKSIKESLSVDCVVSQKLPYLHPNSLGGAVFWNKESFIKIGMENEKFISWGWEDNERYERAKKFDLKIERTSGNLYHLEHRRLIDSSPKNPFINKNKQEFNRIKNMNKEQLIEEIKKWEWC